MVDAAHPSRALFEGEKPFPIIPSCEHFAGSEKLIGKALEQQLKLGGVFDITCDCEDGAPAGREKEHAEMIVRVLKRDIPIHVLIETHGALAEVDQIARLPWMQVLDFGLMDFISGHHGAIPSAAMKSPGQFEHALVARGK